MPIANQLILFFLDALQGCGLLVTARGGKPSLACAMASAFNMPERTIRDVWTEAPEAVRGGETVRGGKSSRNTSDDPLFAPPRALRTVRTCREGARIPDARGRNPAMYGMPGMVIKRHGARMA